MQAAVDWAEGGQDELENKESRRRFMTLYRLRLIDSLAFWDSVLEKQLGCVVMICQLGHGHDDDGSAFEQF